MSETLANLVALFRSFGSGVDMFNAPEDAFHAVIDAIRAELEPNSILMFLSIETLIRSLKNQRLPAIRTVHDSRWQRDRASGERMMYRMMNQLIKLTQPPKTPRALKDKPSPQKPIESTPAVEPIPSAPPSVSPSEPNHPAILPFPSPSDVSSPPEAETTLDCPEHLDNAPIPSSTSDQDRNPQAGFVINDDEVDKYPGTPINNLLSNKTFQNELHDFNPNQPPFPADAAHDRNGASFSP